MAFDSYVGMPSTLRYNTEQSHCPESDPSMLTSSLPPPSSNFHVCVVCGGGVHACVYVCMFLHMCGSVCVHACGGPTLLLEVILHCSSLFTEAGPVNQTQSSATWPVLLDSLLSTFRGYDSWAATHSRHLCGFSPLVFRASILTSSPLSHPCPLFFGGQE